MHLRLKLGCEAAECNGFTVVILAIVRSRKIGALAGSFFAVIGLGADGIEPARMFILSDIDARMSSVAMRLMDSG